VVRTGQNKPPTRSGDETLTDTTRAKLLDAAAEVFTEVGYYRATTREICWRADVNSALINHHFGDKLELYSEVLQRLLTGARIAEVQGVLSEQSPADHQYVFTALVQPTLRNRRGSTLFTR
jgi:AcrR family transcriptional regulator